MYSFGIITDGKEPEKLRDQIKSIYALQIPDYQLVISGEVVIAGQIEFTNLAVTPMPSTAKQGRLGALRNGVCSGMTGDVLVVTDDDMVFHSDWHEGMQKYGDDWDVLSCKILNPDGSRYWDWKGHLDGGNWLLDYNETSPHVSLTGGMTIMKRYVYEKVKWSNDLGFNQAEDVDFTNKIKAAGFRIAFNPYSTITHNAPYTQKGLGVFKLQE